MSIIITMKPIPMGMNLKNLNLKKQSRITIIMGITTIITQGMPPKNCFGCSR